MRRDLERRLKAVETARLRAGGVEIWIEQSNGILRGPRGKTISKDTFEATPCGTGAIVVLPDNGRDSMHSGVLKFVISEVDSRL
jgi:hypothetical protein